MTKRNWVRVNEENRSRTRGYEFVDSVAPPKDIYSDVPVTLRSDERKPAKLTIEDRSSILEKEIEHIAAKILLADRRKKDICRFLHQQLISEIKRLLKLNPLKKDTPLSNNVIAALNKVSKL